MKTDLTITVDAEVLRGCLEDYADEGDRAAQAVAGLKRLMGAAEVRWGSRTWSREEFYER